MSFTVTDRTKESSSTTGTGAFTLSGAPSNYVTFNTAVGVNNFTWYAINHLSANEWEVGYGQLTGATTLTRVLVTAGTNGTSFVNFSAGTKEVFVTLPSAFNGQTLGRTNILMNPHGFIQQETNTPVTSLTPNYFADQWAAAPAGSGFAHSTGVTTGTVSNFDPSHMFMKTTTAKGSLAAGDVLAIAQIVEGYYIRRLLMGTSSAKGTWLRWRASSTQSGTASVSVQNGSRARSFVQSFAVTTTPTDYFLFVPGDTTGTWPTDNTAGAIISFTHASGTTFQTSTLGAWQAGNFVAANTQSNMLDTVNRQLNITDVQWSQSAVLLPFEPMDYVQELSRVQRYWMHARVITGRATSATNVDWGVLHPNTMRVAPTYTMLDANHGIIVGGIGTVVASGSTLVTQVNRTDTAFITTNGYAGLTAGNICWLLSGGTIGANARM